ncbi:MAG: glycosyltransferase family 2 protein, partial [Vicinamibacteraceae bacterium]|nr:glycosyltransferase family 2 protein [Vicinamibacteraceae bacterium]
MSPFETAILASYFFVLAILAVYGWHRYFIVYEYSRNRHKVPAALPPLSPLPRVTIQLPIFNEMYVVNRLVEATCEMDYPKELLEIQVLDDSTDETREIAALAVRRFAALGYDIHYIHRIDRTGYKAGALENGMKTATGQFIAIFDADFVPPRDFLVRTLPQFANPQVGLVQARWGHINEDYSLLTKIQAILLDAHFVLEHGGRNRSGCFFNFNGTAGIWRRETIPDSGGWQHDTLTEDLDLSYRAQLRGWKFVFIPDLVSPAEVPVEMNSFKSQQHRWAKGSIQTALKLLPSILAAPLPLKVKAEAFFHLTANFNYLLMIALSVLMFPAMYVRYSMGWTEMLLIDVPFFIAATWSVGYFYMVCQRELYPDSWVARVKYLPFLMAAGIGLAVNNARAVMEAMSGKQTEFARTPKYGVERQGDEWSDKKYKQTMTWQPFIEVALGLYFTFTVFYALANGIYGSLPFLILFQVGFLYMGLLS